PLSSTVPAGSKGLALPRDASGLNSTTVVFAVTGSPLRVSLPETGRVRPTPEASPHPDAASPGSTTAKTRESTRSGRAGTSLMVQSRETGKAQGHPQAVNAPAKRALTGYGQEAEGGSDRGPQPDRLFRRTKADTPPLQESSQEKPWPLMKGTKT